MEFVERKAKFIISALIVPLFLVFSAAAGEPVDLDMSGALKAALDHSYSIKSSENLYEASQMQRKAAGAERYPTLSLEAGAHYISDLVNVRILTNSLELGSKEIYQTDARLAVPLYTGGKISGAIGAAEAELKARGGDLEATRLRTAWICRRAYLGLLLTEDLVGSAEASLKRIRVIREDVAHLYENGVADSIDILEAELAREKGRQALLKQESERSKASQTLAVILGFDPGTEFHLTEQFAVPEQLIGSFLEFNPDSGSISRPELKALANRLIAAEQAVKINRASWFPNLSAYAGYSGGKPNRNQFDAEWDDYFSVGALLTWNFNLGGRTDRNIAKARKEYEALKMSRLALQEQFLLAAENGLESLKNAYDLYRIAENEKNLTEHKYRLGQEQQQAGEISVNRLVELEADLTAAEALYSASKISFYLTETELLYTIGSSKIYGGAR